MYRELGIFAMEYYQAKSAATYLCIVYFNIETFICMCPICATECLNSNFYEAVIGKYQFFMKLPQISHTHKKVKFDFVSTTASTL